MELVNEKNPKTEKCIEASQACFKSCAETFKHCTEMGGDHALPKHINLLKDCMDICKINEDFMLRDSMHAACIAEECMKICEQCAESCDEIDPNDSQMKACATACRDCAVACRDMTLSA